MKKHKIVKRILYLGLDPSRFAKDVHLVHAPIIRLEKRSFEQVVSYFARLSQATHLLFTSRATIPLFLEYAQRFGMKRSQLKRKKTIAVGCATSQHLKEYGMHTDWMPADATSEGIVALMKTLSLSSAFVFFPHSALSRGVIDTYLIQHNIPHCSFSLYDTHPNPISRPDLSSFDEIWFTSPSTLDAYLLLFGQLPPQKMCKAIGPITLKKLEDYFQKIS